MNGINLNKKGFTLVEVLVGVAVAIILLGIAVGGFLVLRRNQALNSTTDQIISLLVEARSRTLASEGASKYGVHFESGRAVLFKGLTFTEPDANNKELVVTSIVEISPISLNGGGQNLIFERLTGETVQYGTITIRLKSDTSRAAVITITETGLVSAKFN